MVERSYSTSGTRRVNLVTNHQWVNHLSDGTCAGNYTVQHIYLDFYTDYRYVPMEVIRRTSNIIQ
jgi:hypothetical protein